MRKVLIAVTIACGLTACSPAPAGDNAGTEEEQRYDELQLDGRWSEIVKENTARPAQSPACQKVVRLAQYQLGLAGQEALHDCVADSKAVLTTETAALMMSDVYMRLGVVNLAQRAAFETLVATSDGKRMTRALQRLTETAIVTRQLELARKYVHILEERGVSKKWLKDVKPLTEHPELILQHPVYNTLRQNYEKSEDQFFL